MDSPNIKPNFYILGAPKCGTTALSEYLRHHSDICISDPKEAEYFTDVAHAKGKHNSVAEYLSDVFPHQKSCSAMGGAPTRLLRSPEAIPRILEMNPNAKFIVMLRDPVGMFESLYWQQVYSGKENARSPKEAWEKHKKIDTKKPRETGDTDPADLRYGETCRLGEQLERVFEQTNQGQVLALFYDDLKKDARGVYKQTLSFLNIKDDGRTTFPVIHRRKSTRSALSRKLIKSAGRLKKTLGIRRSLRDNPLIQKIIGGTKPISTQLKHELNEYFYEDIEKLEFLTERDLSHWKN